jgi:outer membrane protein
VIVTINVDTVTEHFEYMKLLKSDLEQEAAKYEAELKPKYAAWEEKYYNYRTNLQNNVLTQTQIQNAEKQLAEEKNRLDGLSAKYEEIMAKKGLSVQNEITDSLKNAAKRVNEASYNANYIFAIGTGSAILYSNEVYDITQEVIKELNKTYKK